MQDNLAVHPEILSKAKQWLHSPFDEATQQEVHLLLKNPQKLIDAFYTNLSFGTAGLRGLMGAGTNRVNQYTIAAVTQGLANYIHKAHEHTPLRVVIAYDSRLHSDHFAKEAAKVLAANNIEVFITPDLRPTPFLSFMCHHKQCIAGIMITASHNPPEYNGYKVYWSDGSQVVPPHDEGIIEEVNKVANITQVKQVPFSHPLIHLLTQQDDQAYLQAIQPLQNFPQKTHLDGKKLKVVFSNLHGTAITLLPQALSLWGFTTLHHVEQQKLPDGTFPTAKNPNPELKEALDLGIQLLHKIQGDLFIATDPDADRIGLAILHEGKEYLFNGNQIASLCLYHLLETFKKQKRLSKHHVVISTIVTTPLLQDLSIAYQVKYFETLTGFKYIGEKIRLFEESPEEYEFLFGAEESYGFLYGTHARDKDAIITACLLCEIALLQKEKNKTLLDLLYEIYQKFGVYQEKQLSINLPEGQDSQIKIQETLEHLRHHPPHTLDHLEITSIEDYLLSYKEDCKTKKRSPLKLPKSNVLVYHCLDESKFVIRPSGTEPKIKIYGMLKQPFQNNVDSLLKEGEGVLSHRLAFIKNALLKL